MNTEDIKLIKGDCLIEMKNIPDKSVDLIVTDPPYGMNFQSHRRKEVYDKIANDVNLDWIYNFYNQCFKVMKDDTAIYSFCSWHKIDEFKAEFEKHFTLKNILVWVKNNHGSGDLKASYAPKYEFILYGNKGRRCFEDKRHEDVLNFNKTRNTYHPTEKPTDLIEFLIKNSSKEGDVVLDSFMGSGTTAVACINTNRKFIGIELDENYYNIACKRVEEAMNNKQLNLF